MAPKAPTSCNWVKSIVTDSTLDDFVKTDYLSKKEIMSYRAPNPEEEFPQPKTGEVSFSHITWTRVSLHPAQNSLEMFCTSWTSALKTPDPILCLTSAISKCSVKSILEKNPISYSSESYFTWTARMNAPTARAWNLVVFQSNIEET